MIVAVVHHGQLLYEKSLSVKSAVPHPRILGIIRECGGKAHLQDHSWSKAYEDFWEAFKNYDEGALSVSPKRKSRFQPIAHSQTPAPLTQLAANVASVV